MAVIKVKCPACKKAEVIKFGTNAAGNQRYRCQNKTCKKDTFLLNYLRNGDMPEIKQQIIEMAINGSGVRDTARVLGISMNTVISELKKKKRISKR